jgi:Carboxypeptidase regulatory-like domain
MIRGFIKALFALCIGLIVTGVIWGQAGTATVRGDVTDPQGKQVSAASVTIRNASTGFVRTQQTNSAGSFSFELIPPGDYAIEVEATGFKKAVRNVNALVSAIVDADVRMEIGSVGEVVQVEGASSAVSVDTEDATLGNNFENQQITQLPLESRNVLNLLTLQPGVTKDGYVAGARSDQSNITLDGVDINDAQTTSVSSNRDNPTVSKTLAGPVSGPVLRLNAEAIEEFRVSTVTS